MPAGGYVADILARNPADGSLVLIETQLESTDYRHLGQIMTYLAGLETRTIVWVAASFHDEHLSAIQWLNDHTADPYAFFAVRIRVVRIEDSPLAPLFEVVERPNQWERYLHEIAQPTPSALGQQKQAFWSHYVQRYPEESEYGPANAASSRWHKLPDYELVISFYAARDAVGLFVRGMHGADPGDVAEILEPYRARLADLTGSTEWNEARGHFFQQAYPADMTSSDSWNEVCEWLHDRLARYEQALQECFDGQA